MSNALPFALALYPIGLSGIVIGLLFCVRNTSRFGWSMHVVASSSVMIFVVLTGPWMFTSYSLRFVVLGLFLSAMLFNYRRKLADGVRRTAWSSLHFLFSAFIATTFLFLNVLAVTARLPQRGTIDLSFPLPDGIYAVLQGGTNIVVNPFHALSGNPFSIDLVKLNAYGNRARGIAPNDLEDYEIFGEMLHSPCSGTVLSVRDGMPDNAPGAVDLVKTEGNYLVIDCGEAQILMAHLKSASLLVLTGQQVEAGQPVGRVGNSGNTMEPHLHIEASKEEGPVSLRFDGRVLVMNDLIRA